MSVRGEFRRILGDVVAALRAGGHVQLADELESPKRRADTDLSAAAEEALAILPRVGRAGPASPAAEGETAPDGAPVSDRAERLEAVCRIILGRA